MGNCLNDKNYLRWASRFSAPSPTINKSDTLAEAPPEVHSSRYRSMEKAAEAKKTAVSSSAAPVSETAGRPTGRPSDQQPVNSSTSTTNPPAAATEDQEHATSGSRFE